MATDALTETDRATFRNLEIYIIKSGTAIFLNREWNLKLSCSVALFHSPISRAVHSADLLANCSSLECCKKETFTSKLNVTVFAVSWLSVWIAGPRSRNWHWASPDKCAFHSSALHKLDLSLWYLGTAHPIGQFNVSNVIEQLNRPKKSSSWCAHLACYHLTECAKLLPRCFELMLIALTFRRIFRI